MFADHVIPFVFESLPVRGEIINLSRSWRRMLANHDYDRIVQDTLGHATAATGLIAQSMKFDGTVSLHVQGSGDLRMLVVQCTSDLELRGMASPAPEVTASSFGELMQTAQCAITVDSGERPYQGIVEVNRDSFAASLENYFARSVQIPSHVALVCDDEMSGGILLQKMPGTAIDKDDWNRLGYLAATLQCEDFFHDSGLELIGKLFNEDDVRVYRGRSLVFKCRCSKKKAEDVLRMLGEAEIEAALQEQGSLDVTCEYCGRGRHFDSVDVSKLFADNVVTGPKSVQ
ncbi:MAG: Hsp33 family molecular chaperone HslO [Gammaproteobacteria bacterium]|nr:Hsp33 family molecular chaperone HslO [Gammaproteobacteria bacterium]